MIIKFAKSKPERFSQKNWVGMCGQLPKTITLFMTKTCDIQYNSIYDLPKIRNPIYDLTIASKSCFRLAL